MNLCHSFALAVAALALPLHSPVAAQEMQPAPQDAERIAAATASAEAGGSGAFPAEMVSDPTLPTHTIYRPRDMAAAGPLPVLVWGNGACTNMGNRFRYALTEVASRGYLVIAIGPVGPRHAEWMTSLNLNQDASDPQRLPGSYAAQLNDAIDWALAENARAGSPYFGRLDPQAIAAAGQSCGGLQAISASADRRVRTTMVLNSGTFPADRPPAGGTGDATKASLARLHGPTLWLTGDASDVAFANGAADYAAVSHIPAVHVWHEGTGHSDHWRMPRGGEFVPLMIDWLDWQLKGNTTAGSAFIGSDCRLCHAPGWHIEAKNFAN